MSGLSSTSGSTLTCLWRAFAMVPMHHSMFCQWSSCNYLHYSYRHHITNIYHDINTFVNITFVPSYLRRYSTFVRRYEGPKVPSYLRYSYLRVNLFIVRTKPYRRRFVLLFFEWRFLRSIQRSGAGEDTVPPSLTAYFEHPIWASPSPYFLFKVVYHYKRTGSFEARSNDLARDGSKSCRSGSCFLSEPPLSLKSFVAETRRSTRARWCQAGPSRKKSTSPYFMYKQVIYKRS